MAATAAISEARTASSPRAVSPKARRKSPRSTNMWLRNGDTSTIPGRLTTRRVELGLEQEEVAARMGVARAAYSQYETGKVTPTLEKIEKAAEALETSPQWIAFGGKNQELPVVAYVATTRTWASSGETWPIPYRWLAAQLPGVDLSKLDAVEVSNDSAFVHAGDVVLVEREVRPTEKRDQEFIFSVDGHSMSDNVRRVEGGYEIGVQGDETVRTVSARSIRFHGRVVAVLGAS